jgi:uncharacterized protein DUF3850
MSYTGRYLYRAVTYVLRDAHEVPRGFAVLSVRPLTVEEWVTSGIFTRMRAARIETVCGYHDIKCWPEAFVALADGTKTFEWRRDDRGYRVGDLLMIREWDPHRDAERDFDALLKRRMECEE